MRLDMGRNAHSMLSIHRIGKMETLAGGVESVRNPKVSWIYFKFRVSLQ